MQQRHRRSNFNPSIHWKEKISVGVCTEKIRQLKSHILRPSKGNFRYLVKSTNNAELEGVKTQYSVKDSVADDQLRIPKDSYLESNGLPLNELAILAAREGQRPRPIYTSHKWFARRLGSIFRAILVSAAIQPREDFWAAFYGGANLEDVSVLDPFVGGGTSVFEAWRLGANCIGSDIDPVACAVSKFELEAECLPDLLLALEILKSSIGKKLQKFHQFTSPDGTELTVLHHFWVQVVDCPECKHSFEAHPNFQLSREGKTQWVFCKHCGEVQERKKGQSSFYCECCNRKTEISKGHVSYGKYTCPQCNFSEPLIQYGKRQQTPPKWRVFAVEAVEAGFSRQVVPIRDRFFFKATEEIDKQISFAEDMVKIRRETHPWTFPDAEIEEENRDDKRLTQYGYSNWLEVFNSRQLLHLSLLIEGIGCFPNNVRDALAFALSSHLTTTCMFTSYASGWRRLTPLFSLRAFRHIPRPVEINPWMDGTGRGSFPNTIRKLLRAQSFAQNPKDPAINGGFVSVPAIRSQEKPKILHGDSSSLPSVASESVDIVLSDPPYFDTIAYSELSEFFMPWLKATNLIQVAESPGSIRKGSLAARQTEKEDLESYAQRLGNVFLEAYRTLKPEGLIAFTFRHSKAVAWEALGKALSRVKVVPTAIIPVPGEARVGLHKHNGSGLWDALFVLRKSDRLSVDYFTPKYFAEVAKKWEIELHNCPIPFREADKLMIYRANLTAQFLQGEISSERERQILDGLLQMPKELEHAKTLKTSSSELSEEQVSKEIEA